MDDYGIGNSVRGAIRILFSGSRGTGRTIRMLERYQEGDRIIVTNDREKRRLKHLGKELGKEIQCIVVDPEVPSSLLDHGTPQGRSIFDHTWVEQFYECATTETFGRLKHLQEITSGSGVKHRETKESIRNSQRYGIY